MSSDKKTSNLEVEGFSGDVIVTVNDGKLKGFIDATNFGLNEVLSKNFQNFQNFQKIKKIKNF
jgi:hypothetical protein